MNNLQTVVIDGITLNVSKEIISCSHVVYDNTIWKIVQKERVKGVLFFELQKQSHGQRQRVEISKDTKILFIQSPTINFC